MSVSDDDSTISIPNPRPLLQSDSHPFRDERDHPFCGANIYQPLDRSKKEIRLLLLFPSSDLEEDPKGQLITTTIQHKRHYEAISYVWGNPSDQLHMILDGSRFPIGRNAHTALRYLRYISTTRLVWLDGVCVNQLHIQERNHQVTLMEDIFGEAQGVVFWLGIPSISDEICLRKLHKLASECERPDEDRIRDILADGDWPSNESIETFFSNEFWHRVWIVQEIWLGCWSQESVFQAGFQKLTCTEFMTIIILLMSCRTPNHDLGFPVKMTPDGSVLETVAAFRIFPQSKYARGTFGAETLLILNAHTEATDPRDRIYGFSAFIAGLGIQPPHGNSVETVYKDASFAIYCSEQSLDLLLAQGAARRNAKFLPSWTVDWDESAEAEHQYGTWGAAIRRYHTDAGQRPIISRSGNFLYIAARQLTAGFSASCLGPLFDAFDAFDNKKASAVQTLRQILHNLFTVWNWCKDRWVTGRMSNYASLNILVQDFQRTVMLDKDWLPPRRLNSSDTQCASQAFLAKFLSLIGGVLNTDDVNKIMYSALKEMNSDEALATCMSLAAPHKKRFAVSPCGRLCLLPSCAKEGDRIFILGGCSVPLTLRPVETEKGHTYTVVGGTYVHG